MADILVQWVKLLTAMPASYMRAILSSGSCISNPAPCYVPEQTVGNGPRACIPVTHVEDLDEVWFILASVAI